MYLYSNIIGTFVLNQNFQIREKVLFSKKELSKNFKQLQEGNVLESEKKFLKKFKKIKDLRQEPNQKVLLKVYNVLYDYRKEFYDNNLYLTKTQIKESVSQDLLIIQTSSSINELNKAINMLSKRLREMYGYVLPEVEDKITDHKNFAEKVSKDTVDKLKKDFNVKHSMGAKLSKDDLDSIKSLASTILTMFKQKESKEKHLENLMKKTCLNLTDVAGYLTGAKLVTIAGSLRNMVMMPASTIQLLGAEKALFRHMVKGSKSPKYGVIFEHSLIQKVAKQDRGKAARALADKILLAVKVDFFKGDYIADKLNKELKERFGSSL